MLDFNGSPKTLGVFAAGALFVAFVLTKLIVPTVTDAEPPLLKPRIPFIGHIIGLIKDGGRFPNEIYNTWGWPIATLPLLNRKMYMVWDPSLIQGILKSRDISMFPFAVEFWAKFAGVSKEHLDRLDQARLPRLFQEMHAAIRGPPLLAMNVNALEHVAKELNSVESGRVVEMENMYTWMRDFLSLATATALYGKHNPFAKNPALLEDLWTFESGIASLSALPFPSIFAAKAVRARNRVQVALLDFYGPHHDSAPEAAAITKLRADHIRDIGLSEEHVARSEIALPFAAMSNVGPTTFWLAAYIFADLRLLEQLRVEVAKVVKRDGNDGTAVIRIADVESTCPLLVSCYRETLRVTNIFIGFREVTKDTTVIDSNGNGYLLKKGYQLQFSVNHIHHLETVWGPDAAQFRGDRFLSNDDASEKAQRGAYFPFGGGIHLCPGRNFAFAEILCTMVALITGFELVGVEDGKQVPIVPPALDERDMPATVGKPLDRGQGLRARLSRREGWELATWKFTT